MEDSQKKGMWGRGPCPKRKLPLKRKKNPSCYSIPLWKEPSTVSHVNSYLTGSWVRGQKPDWVAGAWRVSQIKTACHQSHKNPQAPPVECYFVGEVWSPVQKGWLIGWNAAGWQKVIVLFFGFILWRKRKMLIFKLKTENILNELKTTTTNHMIPDLYVIASWEEHIISCKGAPFCRF